MTRAEIIGLTRFDQCPYCTKTQLRKHCNDICNWLRCVTCHLNFDVGSGRVATDSGFSKMRGQ